MAKILVYNNNTNRMEIYYRGESQSMPYNSNRSLTVREFRGRSNSGLLWTDRRAMEAWNSFRYIYGRPIYVGYAFRRPWEGGHGNLSQHYAGLAFDVGQNLDEAGRNAMRNLAVNSGIWNYVEPANLTPRWEVEFFRIHLKNYLFESVMVDYLPQHFLYFFPLPQGHGSFLPIFSESLKCGKLVLFLYIHDIAEIESLI